MAALACVLIAMAVIVTAVVVKIRRQRGYSPDDSDYIWVDVDSDDPGIKKTRFMTAPKVGDIFTVISQRTEKVDYFLIDEVDHMNGMMDCHILQEGELEDRLKTH